MLMLQVRNGKWEMRQQTKENKPENENENEEEEEMNEKKLH